MKKALLDHHRRIAQQESRTMYDPYLYEDVPVLKNNLSWTSAGLFMHSFLGGR